MQLKGTWMLQQENGDNTESMIDEFLSAFLCQTEAGLFIAESHEALSHLITVLKTNNFRFASDWKDIFERLNKGERVSVVLSEAPSKQILDIVRQYNDRQGMIQILNRETLDYSSAHIDVNVAKLLIIVSASEQSFAGGLLSTVGMIARVGSNGGVS